MARTPPASDPSVLFTRHLPLPILFFGHDLHLTFCNDAAKHVLGSSLEGHPHAGTFFGQEPGEPDSPPAAPPIMLTKLDEMVNDGTRLDWTVGSKIRLWMGRKGERICQWYEAIVQNLPLPDHTNMGTQPAGPLSGQYLSVLLLRRLTAEQIPSASLPLVADSIASLPASAGGADEKKHREQDTGLTSLLGRIVEQQGLTNGQLKSVVDHMPHLCVITTPDGQPTYYNKKWFEFTGLTLEQARDIQNWLVLHHADDMPSTLGKWRYSCETGEPLNVEYRLRNLDGTWQWVAGRGNPVRDGAGNITHWVLTITDINELVQTRWEAIKIKEHVKAVLNGANVLLLSVTREFVVTFFGGSSDMALAGAVPENQVVGSLLKDVWPDPVLHDEVTKLMTERKEFVTFQNGVESHGRIYRYRLTLLYGQEGGDMVKSVIGVIIVACDVTDIEAAAAALQQAEVERTNLMASETAAREASKLKTHFVTNISHEIRTPIAHMIGISELLLVDRTLSENQRRLVEKCLHSGEILLELVGMVLDIGKVEAGKLELEQLPFRLSEVLADAELFALAAQKKGLDFIPDVSPSLFSGELIGDRLRLRQVLANFLSNAVKFTSRGSITLRIRDEPGSQPSEVMVTIEVQDTGCGIEGEAMQRLFKPFHQADSSTVRQFGGSGLGLFLAQSFVAKMGGNVTLLSEYGTGTIISASILFTKVDVLPEPDTEPPSTPTSEPSSPDESTGTKALNRGDVRLLLADDNDLIREMYAVSNRNFRSSLIPDAWACTG
ncbi:hypothetical protein FRB94_000766 [Tulasnella sp. JGI-2019a]|nr:hypothetical protein FRB94_000766 [Tulasnella sp. JGI-2019a]